MDESSDLPKPAAETVECGMCKWIVPIEQTRTFNGRVLCSGCLASWYDEDEDEKEK